MKIISKEIWGQKYYLSLPSIVGENEPEEEAACRMNGFYSALENEIKAYAESDDFPAGARYKAEFACKQKDGTAEISVVLSLRHRGRTQRKQLLRHVWQDGVIIKSGQ